MSTRQPLTRPMTHPMTDNIQYQSVQPTNELNHQNPISSVKPNPGQRVLSLPQTSENNSNEVSIHLHILLALS